MPHDFIIPGAGAHRYRRTSLPRLNLPPPDRFMGRSAAGLVPAGPGQPHLQSAQVLPAFTSTFNGARRRN